MLYINDTGNNASNNLLLLLAAAGVAQQSQGYQLERDAGGENVKWPITISFLSAVLLQGGEFAVVSSHDFCLNCNALTFKQVYNVMTNSATAGKLEDTVFASYALGYSLFGVIMFLVLLLDVDIVTSEVMYSVAGLFSKLAVFLGDYSAYKHNLDAARAVLGIMSFISAGVILVLIMARMNTGGSMTKTPTERSDAYKRWK